METENDMEVREADDAVNPQSAIRNPQSTPPDAVEIASLHRRVLRETGWTRAMLTTVIAVEMAAGRITAEKVLQLTRDKIITRAACAKARRLLDRQKPPDAPQRPYVSFLAVLWGSLFGPSAALRAYKVRRINWLEAMGQWRRRQECCRVPHRPEPTGVKKLKAGPYAGTDHAPPAEPPGPVPTDAGIPLVRLGPGGDFVRDLQG